MLKAYKVSFATDHYYTRAMYPWHLERPGVISVEQVEDTGYVKAACVFSAGVSSPFAFSKDDRERIINLISLGECLWHAVSLVCQSRCYCADCATGDTQFQIEKALGA